VYLQLIQSVPSAFRSSSFHLDTHVASATSFSCIYYLPSPTPFFLLLSSFFTVSYTHALQSVGSGSRSESHSLIASGPDTFRALALWSFRASYIQRFRALESPRKKTPREVPRRHARRECPRCLFQPCSPSPSQVILYTVCRRSLARAQLCGWPAFDQGSCHL
jgi:hypothetical protein